MPQAHGRAPWAPSWRHIVAFLGLCGVLFMANVGFGWSYVFEKKP